MFDALIFNNFIVGLVMFLCVFQYFSMRNKEKKMIEMKSKIDICKSVVSKSKEGICADLRVTEPFDAKEAKNVVLNSASDKEVQEILLPIYDKIHKASEKGGSNIFLSGRDWYYCDNEKYKKAKDELLCLGYQVWRDNNGFGVQIKW